MNFQELMQNIKYQLAQSRPPYDPLTVIGFPVGGVGGSVCYHSPILKYPTAFSYTLHDHLKKGGFPLLQQFDS